MFDPLKLGLEEVVSCLVWVLGTELWSSSRVVSALNHLSSSVVLNLWVSTPFRDALNNPFSGVA